MLDQTQKKRLGHLRNWTYEERPGGFKIISLGADTLHALSGDAVQRERLVNLIAFDSAQPFFIEIPEWPAKTNLRDNIQTLIKDLDRAMGDRLKGSKVVFEIQDTALGNPYNLPAGIELKYRILAAPDESDDESEAFPPATQDISKYVQSHSQHILALAQATPEGVHHLAQAVVDLMQAGFVHFSITLDHQQDWDEADFPVIGEQWRRILAAAEDGPATGRVTIAQCSQILENHEYLCEPGRQRVFIAPGGALWPCRAFYTTRDSQSFVIGNIDQGLIEYDNLAFDLFDPLEMEGCNQCAWLRNCANSCFWLNHRQNKTFYKTAGSVCAYEKAVRTALKTSRFPVGKSLSADSPWKDYLPLLCAI